MRIEDPSGNVKKPIAKITISFTSLRGKPPKEFKESIQRTVDDLKSLGFLETEVRKGIKVISNSQILEDTIHTFELY